MEDENPGDRRRRRGRSAALLTGGLLAGGVVLGAVGVAAANAAPVLTAAVATPSSSTSTEGQGGQRGDETAVTGTKGDTLRAAALKAVPGATVDRIETDSGDAAYEVHMTKSDGSRVTVKFDAALKQTAVESGMGKGGGGHRGNDHDAEHSSSAG